MRNRTNGSNGCAYGSSGFDAAGNRNAFSNPRGKNYAWAFTPVNLTGTLTTPLGRMFGDSYDGRDLLATVIQPSGNAATLTYFDDKKLEQTVDPVGTITYGYDSKGRLYTVTEGTKVIKHEYDSLDRLKKFTDGAGNVIQYQYDGAGNLTVLTYPDNKTVTYVYDSADRLDHVTDWASRVTQYAYDGHSRLSTITFPNGTVRAYGYDSAGRVNSIQDSGSGGTIISKFKLDHDPLDRISKETVTPEPAAFTITPASMTYDDDDRLATWNGQTCASDPDGNLTTGPLQGSLTTFSFDARNRFTGIGNTTYTYDAKNRRVSQTISGVTTAYVNDPQGKLSRLLVAASVSSTTRYVYANGLLLYQDNGSDIRVHHYDPRGSTVAITGSAGTVTDRVVYGDYGEIVSRTGTTATPFLYNGAYGVQTDSNGLCFMRARYYSTETRRFLSADPIGFSGGNNWFAFVGGNPANYFDSSGFDRISFFAPGSNEAKAQAQDSTLSSINSVAAHGDPYGIENDRSGNPTAITNQEAANLIMNDPNYNPDQPILLNACSTGGPVSSGDNAAQQIANYTNNVVIAPTTVLDWNYHISPWLSFVFDGLTFEDGGTYKIFYPKNYDPFNDPFFDPYGDLFDPFNNPFYNPYDEK